MPAQKLGPCKAPLASGVVLPNKRPDLSRELLLLAHPLEEVAFCPLTVVNNRWLGSQMGGFGLAFQPLENL